MDFDQIITALARAREDTFGILDWICDPADLVRRANPAFRPILWHLGHMGAFEEWWLLRKVQGASPINQHFQLIFDPIKTPRDHPDDELSRGEIEAYLELVRSRVLTGSYSDDDRYFFHLVLEHELQHQETLAMLMQMLPIEKKRRPFRPPPASADRAASQKTIAVIPGGKYSIGATPAPFVYDNEKPAHEVELGEFSVETHLVTNAEYAEFIQSGGYENRQLWTNEGWEWRVKESVTKPQYWTGDGPWQVQQMFAVHELESVRNHPVSGISWHEAQAYVRFAGKRLLTETEWEAAASRVRESNCCGNYLGTTPVGAIEGNQTASGCFDMTGNVWEWTSTTFEPYTGFKAYPYPDYSELWFDGDHRVLRGGSWMTRRLIARITFRNFFRPQFRFAFSGIRCAQR